MQTVTEPAEHSTSLYGHARLTPCFVYHRRRNNLGTSKLVYLLDDLRTATDWLRGNDGSPYDGKFSKMPTRSSVGRGHDHGHSLAVNLPGRAH